MLTERDKKAGIIMLICGAVFIIGLIVFRVISGRSGEGVRGTGVSAEKDALSTTEVRSIIPTFYDGTFGSGSQQVALSQVGAYDVYEDLIHESEGNLAVSSYLDEVEAFEEQNAQRYDTVDYSEMINKMSSSVVGYTVLVDGEVPSDDKSVTSTFVELFDVVSRADLMLADNSRDYSGLYSVFAYQKGSLSVSSNSVDSLYTNVIVPSYADGTYGAFKVTQDNVYCIGGNELFALYSYMGDHIYNSDDISTYTDNGETLQGLVDSGEVSLSYLLSDEYTEASSIYNLCGISYENNSYYLDTLNATEMLVIIHIVNNRVCVEKYAVGNVWGITADYDAVAETIVTEDGGELPVYEEKEVPVFTGYYCW